MVNFAPRGPNEIDAPALLRFTVTPGAILIRLQNRKLILNVLSSFGRIRILAVCVLRLDRTVLLVNDYLSKRLLLRQFFGTGYGFGLRGVAARPLEAFSSLTFQPPLV